MTAKLIPLPRSKEPARPERRPTIAAAARATDRPASPYDVRDCQINGLLLRVQMSGKRSFYVQVSRGKRIRIGPVPAFTTEAAREAAKKILLDPTAHEKRKSEGVTLGEFIDADYEAHALAHLKGGRRSVQRVRAIWAPLMRKRIADITVNEIERARTKRINEGVAPATVNRDISALRGAITHWARTTRHPHPLAGMRALKVADDETIRYLTDDEAKKLRKALTHRDEEARTARANANEWRKERGYELLPEITGYSDHMTPLTLLALNTGLRRGELFSLTWDSVDLHLKTLTVKASHSKGANTRTVPLTKEAIEVLGAIKPKGKATGLVFRSPITGERFTDIKNSWALIAEAAGLQGLRFHDLRHTYASTLVQRGVSLYAVQALLGHSSSRMTQRYARLSPGVLADAVKVLES